MDPLKDISLLKINPLQKRPSTQHSRSMEDEARDIRRTALAEEGAAPRNLAETIRRRFAAIELAIPPREPMREPPALER